MSNSQRDLSAEAHARYLGAASLYINTDGSWSVGLASQVVKDFQRVKYGSITQINDDTFQFTARTVEVREGGGYTLTLQSNQQPTVFYEAVLDSQGNATGGRVLSLSEMYSTEMRTGIDLNGNGGLGDARVLVDDSTVNLYVDGEGNFQIETAPGQFVGINFEGQSLNRSQLGTLEFNAVTTNADGGFDVFLKDSSDTVLQASVGSSGVVNPTTIQTLGTQQLAQAEARTGEDLNARTDTVATAGWTSQLKTTALRTEVDAQMVNGKLSHAGLVKVVQAAIQTVGTGTVGNDLMSDLKALAARGNSVFTTQDLNGQETGYLSYVFDQLVNGSKGNAFYHGGSTQQQNLGNLSDQSNAQTLQRLTDKWLLGKDLPNPNTQGDTANPNATAASGIYKAFDAPLITGGTVAFDVNQGSAGTCYLLAAIATVAQVNPSAFQAQFVSNGTGANGLNSWGVRFFDTAGKAHWVTVNNELVVRSTDDTQATYTKVKGVDAQGNATAELWAPLIEKAYAQANELQIFARTNAANAMYAIEGGFAEGIVNVAGGAVTQFAESAYLVNNNPILQTSVVPTGSTALAEYTKALNSNKPFFIVSFTQSKDAQGASLFVSGHAFIGWDADPSNPSNTSLKVYNPWGASARTDANPSPNFLAPFDADLVSLVGTEGISFWVGV